ncbi:MAG TPA: hypothetical protein VEW48_08945 [Thermoanaerobaculia bacterium]|nr:hypothetical protein [Thermoanaerobaculia bacterium]
MSGSSVVLDSDFLSAFLKIDRLPLVRSFYQAEHLLIPPSVYREVSLTSLLQRLADIPWLRVESPEPGHLEELSQLTGFLDLGAGEREAIGLALQRPGSVLLINDNRARREALQRGVQAVGIPEFLLACKISRFLDRDQLAGAVHDLQEKDRYGFRADVLARLLS